MSGSNLVLTDLRDLDYASGVLADCIEQQIAATLPPIPGLEPDMDQAERVGVMALQIEQSRGAFIALYGDAFGCERRAVDRAEPFAVNADVTAGRAILPT